MVADKIKIGIFQPYNARRTNAFYSGQHPVFRYLQENYNYEVTYFIDDENVKFDTVNIKYIRKDRIKTFILRGLRKIFTKYKPYWKIPYYKDLDFSKYEVIITEGIHYLFLDYFKSIGNKVILNDSISHNYTLPDIQKEYLNKYFNKSLAVVVNNKIPILYKKNDLNIKTFIIGHAVDTDLISFIKREKCEGYLLSVGRLVPEKGFQYIIKAVALLRYKYPNIKLDIYGIGQQKEELQNLINSLNAQDIIFLKGFLKYEELLKKMSDYDLFISHSIATKNWEEYFGMANLEAMVSGLPVISSNCGAVPWVLKGKAVIVGQKRVSEICEAVESFVNNPEKTEKFSTEGRKYVEKNYSIESMAKMWDKIIKSKFV